MLSYNNLFLSLLARLLLLSYLIIFSNFSLKGQNIAVIIEQEIKKTDSLLLYNNLIEAEYKLKYLEELLNKNRYESKKSWEGEVMLLQTYLCLIKEQHSKAGEIALKLIDLAEKYKLREIEYKACLISALVYEQAGYFILCKNYLDKAYYLYQKNKLDHVFSNYCIRVSSYYRLTNNKDSAIIFAYKALDYAKKYKPKSTNYLNGRDLVDSYLLLCLLLPKTDYREAVKFGSLAAQNYLRRNEYASAAFMYNNISSIFLREKIYKQAFVYNDSALLLQKKHPLSANAIAYIYGRRSKLFDSTGNIDSAYHYYKQSHEHELLAIGNTEAIQIKDITEKYENDKKEVTIKNQRQQMVFIIILLAIVIIASVLFMRQNIKINSQNSVISKQLAEITKTVEQKQVLLSEFQHRVKNNMQHMISILEIQKESASFSTMEELTRSNQNRIYSMALLHKKLHVSDNVDDVDLKRYIIELAELVKDSYSPEKHIDILNRIETEVISIEKALPLGLIIVELISNSIKHAFAHVDIGIIRIEITKDAISHAYKLHYSDNGRGFDFDKIPEKGLGIEIIKGLADQLNGTVITSNKGGFNLILHF